jgi:hypothetical protein
MGRVDERLAAAIVARLGELHPHLRVVEIEPLAPDATETRNGTTEKVAGYGEPLRIRLTSDRTTDLTGDRGDSRYLVWHGIAANEFGHDRRADRLASALLAYDDFAVIPQHVEAIDVGVVASDGTLVSLPAGAEPYVLTTYAPGTIYAGDLRRIAHDRFAGELDLARADALADYLAALHEQREGPHAYRRAVRDLVGHGEGIFGIIDGYPHDVPAAPPARLRAIEERCSAWRWRLRDRAERLVRTHGDFHPFNVVFDAGTRFSLLDASRGTCGDAADDLTAMAVNFVLFAAETPHSWRDGLGRLWHRFWSTYFAARSDHDLLAVAPPFFAWRALVVCNPRFYPRLSERARDQLLGLATRALDAGRLDLEAPDALFT